MEYTIQEKVMATSWALAFENIEESRRLFTQKYNKEAPPNRTISYWKKKLLETGSLSHDRPQSGRPVSASGDEMKEIIVNAVKEDSTKSTRQLSSDHNVSYATVWRILNTENFHPYKPMYSHFLSDGDDDRRLQFCEEMIAKFQADPAFHRKLVFSDECVFALTSSVNKHNVHYWGTENPNVRFQNPGKTPTLVVWAAIGYGGVVASDLSRETMINERYCQILDSKVIPYFRRNADKLFQQDGASPHYSLAARHILNTRLQDRWIGRRGPIEWPARSPDLTPCGYWLWSYLRSKVYPNDTKYTCGQKKRTGEIS